MAPWWTWPVVKASLTFLSMIFCIVIAAVGTSSVVVERPNRPSEGLGVFTMKINDAEAQLVGSKNPVHLWGAVRGEQEDGHYSNEAVCKPFKIMWQCMQGCVIIAII
eukprot:Rhum_TRINITY_DN13460_c0_g2::Rhum_TRINITY_DN13460_c0_g2_i1::g.59815::m.59815